MATNEPSGKFTIDWTLNVGTLISLVLIIGSCIVGFSKLEWEKDEQKLKMQREREERIAAIAELKAKTAIMEATINEIAKTQAVQAAIIDRLEERGRK